MVSPAHLSLTRLEKRLPLVEKLVAGGKVHEAACAKVIAAVEADLAVVSNAEELGKLQEAGRKRTEGARDAMKGAIEKLRRLLPTPVECYSVESIPAPKPQSRLMLDRRLARIEALEREGKIRPSVAALVREAIERQDTSS